MCLTYFLNLINFTSQPAPFPSSSLPFTPLLPQDHPLPIQKGAGLLCTSGKPGISNCCKIKHLLLHSGWTMQSSLRNRFPRANQSTRNSSCSHIQGQDTKLSHIGTFFLIRVSLLSVNVCSPHFISYCLFKKLPSHEYIRSVNTTLCQLCTGNSMI